MTKLSKKTAKRIADLVNTIEVGYIMSENNKDGNTLLSHRSLCIGQRMVVNAKLELHDEFGIGLEDEEYLAKLRTQAGYWHQRVKDLTAEIDAQQAAA